MIHFEEKQPFYKNSISWVAIPAVIPAILIEASETLKSENGSYEDLAIIILVESLVMLLLFTSRLDTHIDEHGISYRFFPFQFKKRFIAWDTVSTIKVRKYDPLGEYWGWGIKGTRKNRAINIAGDIGLQLELKNGRKLLIGTLQKMERVVEKIQSANLVQ
jgi:hypothetical protein